VKIHHLAGRIYPHLLVYETSRRWFRDFATYHHGMTWWEFWVNYTLTRQCFNDVVKTDGEREAFFTDWPLYRQAWRNRNRTWYDVLGHMTNKHGRLLDYGCGNGGMIQWLGRRRPEWFYYGVEIPETPHTLYAQWCKTRYNLKGGILSIPYPGFYDVIVCQETLEHLSDPMSVLPMLLNHLAPRGVFIWDYINDGQGKDRSLTLFLLDVPESVTSGVYVRH